MGAKIAEIVQKVQWGAQRTVSAAGCTGAGWGACASPCHPLAGSGVLAGCYWGKSGCEGCLGCC